MSLADTPFPSYLEKQQEVEAAWTLCEQRWASLPSPLTHLATRFLQSVSGASGTHRHYFSNPHAPPLLYLPIWLFDSFVRRGILSSDQRPTLVQLLAATMQGYIYVRTQDDVLDEPERADCNLLLLGNVSCSAMTRAYAEVLGPQALLFWREYDQAMVDFTNLTLAERDAVLRDDPYEIEAFEEHADKVAFARIPMIAVATIALQLDLAPRIKTLIHQLGIAYGLVNDVVGWTRDLQAGQRTYLLARAGLRRADILATREIQDAGKRAAIVEELTESLRQKLYEGRLLHSTITEALAMHSRALETANLLGMDEFTSFHKDRCDWLSKLDSQISALTLTRVIRQGRTS